jgi:GT2 family glycosyltransferase
MQTSIEPKIDISVIIPNYRSEGYLEKNIISVSEKIGRVADIEIILVNNDGKEKLENIKKSFENVKIIDRGENIGFGAAINLGAKMAQGKYLFFLNPDCEIIAGDARQIIDLFEADKSIGILGCQLVGDDSQIQKWSAGTEMTISNLIRNNLGFPGGQKIWESKKKIRASWVAGTAMFVKKGLFDEIGGFDEKYFMYFEDVDLCKRAEEAEKKTMYSPNFKVRHFGGGSYEDKRIQKRHYYDSQRHYFKKHSGKIGYSVLSVLQQVFGLKL